jgi:hypothetical protein
VANLNPVAMATGTPPLNPNTYASNKIAGLVLGALLAVPEKGFLSPVFAY